MKKMVIYGTDRWMKELLTLSRFEKIAYFVDDKMRGGGENSLDEKEVKIYPTQVLLKENKDNLLIIIFNSRKYKEAAEKLIEMSFIENVHFFNGWKLDGNFYHVIGANQDWKLDEENTDNIFENNS